MALGESAGLFFRINGDSSQGRAEVEKFRKDLKQLEKAEKEQLSPLQNIAAQSGLTADQYKNLASSATMFVGAATTMIAMEAAAIKMLYDLASAAAAYGDQLKDTAQKTNVSTDAIQAWNFAAEQSGSSTEVVNKSLAKFSTLLGQAADGNEKAQKTLDRYNITATDTDTALQQAIESIMKMTDENQQNSAAAALFKDKSGDVINILREMNGDLAGAIKKLRDLGIMMSEEDVEAAAKFTDTMDLLDKQLAAAGRTIGMEVLPVFLEMAQEISDWLKDNPGEIKFWAQAFQAALIGTVVEIKSIALWIRHLTDTFATMIQVAAAVKQAGFQAGAAIDALLTAYNQRAGERLKEAKAIYDMFMSIGKLDDPRPSGKAGGGPKRRAGDEDEDSEKKDGKKDTRTDKQVYQDFVRELGKVGVQITSGFRTYAEQVALYNRLPKGEAAVPGTSDHEFWKAVDLPPDVSRELLEKAARAAGVTLGKGTVHQGTGRHRHQTFKKGREEGGGEEEAERERLEAEKRAKELQEIELKFAEDTERRKFEIGQTTTKHLLDDAERQFDLALDSGRFREAEEAARTAAELRVQLIRDETTELQRLYNEKVKQASATTDAVLKKKLEGEAAEAFHKLQIKTIELQGEESDSTKKLGDDIKKITKTKDEQTKSWNKYVEALKKAADEEDKAAAKRNREALEKQQVINSPLGGGIAGGLGVDLVSIFDQNDQIKSQADYLKDIFADLESSIGGAIGSLMDGLMQLAIQWIITGEISAKAALQMAAGVALGIAKEALIKGIFEYAEGMAALANPFLAWTAPFHFAAAKMYFTTAAIAGAAGVGLALGARAAGGGSARGGSRGPQDLDGSRRRENERNESDLTSRFSGFGRNVQAQNPIAQMVGDMLSQHIDRQNQINGAVIDAVVDFTNKFGTAPMDHVLVAGSKSGRAQDAIATAGENSYRRAGRGGGERLARSTGQVK